MSSITHNDQFARKNASSDISRGASPERINRACRSACPTRLAAR